MDGSCRKGKNRAERDGVGDAAEQLDEKRDREERLFCQAATPVAAK